MHDLRFKRTRAAVLAGVAVWALGAMWMVHVLGVLLGVVVGVWGVSIVVYSVAQWSPSARRAVRPRPALGARVDRPIDLRQARPDAKRA